ncbi:hypothetical protein [Aquabacterium sp.]|uniref:hypothetical protein n=1 Tax=Aquabacterium sp. TaxID=1872578 RepID=UPI003D6CAE07
MPSLALALTALSAQAAPPSDDPLSRDFYSKYPAATATIKREPGKKTEPPTQAELANFDAFLDRMRGARDRLQSQCLGGQSKNMTRTFNGQNILVLPTLFAECEADAKTLSSGGSVHDQTVIPGLMRYWNAYWNAQYSPPKGAASDLQAWRDKAGRMTRLDPPQCSGMAGVLMDELANGPSESPRKTFEKYLPLCGDAWAKMFESSLPKPKPAAQSTDPFSRDFYALYPKTTGTWAAVPGKGAPPPESGIKAFENHLATLRDIRDRFRQDCIGPNASLMIQQRRGVNVLAWPDRFDACESDAGKLFEPLGLFDSNMAKTWNPYWGANYAPPRGDAADLESWKRWKGKLVRFNSGCEKASWRIIHSGEPGFPDTPKQIHEQMKGRCGAQWATIFQPTEEAAAKEGKSRADDDFAEIDRGQYQKGQTALSKGEQEMRDAVQARASSHPNLTEKLTSYNHLTEKAGSIGGVQIFGGENGQMLEMAVRSAGGSAGAMPPSSTECNLQAEEDHFAQQLKALEGKLSKLSIEQQQCMAARTYSQGLRRLVAAQQRCGQASNAAKNQASLNDVLRQERDLCTTAPPPQRSAPPSQQPSTRPKPAPPAVNPRGSGKSRCGGNVC